MYCGRRTFYKSINDTIQANTQRHLCFTFLKIAQFKRPFIEFYEINKDYYTENTEQFELPYKAIDRGDSYGPRKW